MPEIMATKGTHVVQRDPKTNQTVKVDEVLHETQLKKAEIPTIQILVIDDQLRSWYQFLQDVGSRETTKMLAPLAPERRGDLARLGLKAVLGGTLASMMTATVVGVFL